MKIKIFFLAFFLILISFNLSCHNIDTYTSDVIQNPTRPQISGFYQQKIQISSNKDFHNLVLNEGWEGNGSEQTPYQISGLKFENIRFSIEISNTSVFFEINNCTFNNGSIGVFLDNVTNAEMSDNEFFDYSVSAVYIHSSSRIIIANNYLSDNFEGIILESSTRVSLTDNRIFKSTYSGIRINASPNNTLVNNNLRNAGFILNGTKLAEFQQFDVRNNRINGRYLVYLNNEVNGSISEDSGQIILINCSDVIISNKSISTASIGLILSYCSNLTLSNNYLSNNQHSAIWFYSGNDTKIINNTIHDNTQGIAIHRSENIEISENQLYYNNESLELSNSYQNSINSNIIFNNNQGIVFHNSSENLIFSNVIYSNEISGMSLILSPNNTISQNHLIDNGFSFKGLKIEQLLQTNVFGNLVNGKPLIYWVNVSNKTLNKEFGQIVLLNCSRITIRDYEIKEASIGIFAAYCEFLVIKYNSFISNSQFGIYIFNSSFNSINYNFLDESDLGLSNSTSNNIILNRFVNCGLSVSGNVLSHYFQGAIYGNTINGKLLSYWRNIFNRTVSKDSGQIFLINCSLIKVKNLELSSIPIGICFVNSVNISIFNNILIGNRKGIVCFASLNVSIHDNIIVRGNSLGLEMLNAYNVEILRNSFSYHQNEGLKIFNSENISLIRNSFYANQGNGILCFSSNAITVFNNSIKNNIKYGLSLRETLEGNIAYNNFLENNLDDKSQAFDQNNISNSNLFSSNYWSDLIQSSDDDEYFNGIYYINGNTKSIDYTPLTGMNLVEIYLLPPPIIIDPNEKKEFSGIIEIVWSASVGVLNQSVNYEILYSHNGGKTWICIIAHWLNTSYQWNTSTVQNGENYQIKVVARDSEGLLGIDISDNAFTIQNGPSPYAGITLVKLLIALNLLSLIGFLGIISYPYTKRIQSQYSTFRYNRQFFTQSIYFQGKEFAIKYKWLLLSVIMALILSGFRAWLIDPVIVVDDGYNNYARYISKLLFDWTYEIDKYPIPKHIYRVGYPFLIALFSLFLPFGDIIFSGRIISLFSFFIAIIYLLKILQISNWINNEENYQKIAIIFVLNPTITTHILRFETDILFLALVLYAIYKYMEIESIGFSAKRGMSLILTLILLVLTREVGIVLVVSILLYHFFNLPNIYRVFGALSILFLIILSFLLEPLREILFLVIWSTSTYDYAVELVYRANFLIIIEIIFDKVLNTYILGKTIESLFWIFFPSVIFGIIGFLRYFRIQNKEKRVGILFSIISLYLMSYLFLYMILKSGRGLDRFWIPLLPFLLIFLPYTADLSWFPSYWWIEIKESFLEVYDKKAPNKFKCALEAGMAAIKTSIIEFSNIIVPDEITGASLPNNTYKLILILQILIFIVRFFLSLISTGVLPVYG